MKGFWKKFLKRGAIALCVSVFALSLTACGGTDYYTVTFESNGGSSVASQQVEAGKTVTEPADPTKDGYNFTAWYSDEDLQNEYDFASSVTADMTLYAGWNVSGYTVTFDLNYEGAESTTSTVEKGQTLARPEDPVRDGYMFMGWFTDEECTEAYDFGAAVTGDLTLYASWFVQTEGTYIATFYMNDGTDAVWQRVSFETGSFYQDIEAKVTDAVADGLHFTGWYSDEECTEQYTELKSFSENISLYAGWQNVYTMEAEHVNLEGKVGNGYSGSTSGTGMITGDNTDNMTASNGYYVGWLYKNGMYLSFEFEAEEAADDVTIVFRLTAQYNAVEVTGDEIYVGINPDDSGAYEQKYDFPMSIPSYSEFGSGVMDFNNYVVVENASIKAGTNIIEICINNSIKGVGGTMNAAAPLIDCMYLYTDAEGIAQTKYNTEFVG